MEVVMKNGKKHAVFRSLATLGNESNVNLDISISHLSPNSGTSNNSVVEEIFQNQRYQPSSGWGNNWSGFGSVVSGPWSTRDFSNSSKDFSEPPLPTGWRWSSTWTIDKSQSADKDGWACGPDFRSLRWPPTSSKSCTKSSSDLVRRRRWIRTRQQMPNSDFSVINPGASVVLPWRSTSRDSNKCLQIRPSVDHPQPPYAWGYAVTVGSGYAYGKDQALVEQLNLKDFDKWKNEETEFMLSL
ncbi:Vacuolar protein sorting-associated protein [Trema orientale]|uniref:Vacuolar protein sorting-associated protein n=1 Tax=Trema orientale TaxID=63057 RepID=A0A2P5AV97_TREOI|nr:Vacuolar protein sorting-associated protein [Trema orientale]